MRKTFHHEFVGLENRDKPRSKQPSVVSFFTKAAAPAVQSSGGGGDGAGCGGGSGTQLSKWQPAPPLLILPPQATKQAPEEARKPASAAAGATTRGQARAAADAASDVETAPKAVRRIR